MKEQDHVSYLDTEHSGEYKNFHLQKADNELFNEKDNVCHAVVSVRRVKKKKTEDWQVLTDNKVVLLLKGTRFTNAEREFLRTVPGMKFLMEQFKAGKKSVVKIKEELKSELA